MDNVIKYEPVSFKNLPVQDYAKAKKLHEMLSTGQYVKTTLNNFDEFIYFIKLLSTHNEIFSVKQDKFQTNMYIVCRQE